MNTLFIFIANIFLIALIAFNAHGAMAKMAPVINTPISDVIAQLQKSKPSKEEKPSLLEWAIFARDVVGIQYVVSGPSVQLSTVTTERIISSIQMHIGASEWKPIANTAKKTLNEWRPLLEGHLSSKPFTWAWVQYQLDDSVGAKKSLTPLFDAEFMRVMKLKEAIYGLGGSPMGEINRLNNALKSVSTESEKTELDKKMQKAKVHVSNLPEAHVVT